MNQQSIWEKKAQAGERWNEGDARAALSVWKASGESLSAFAQRYGLTEQRLYWWRTRIAETAVPKRVSELLPVTVSSSMLSLGTCAIAIMVGDIRIEIDDPSRVTPSWLATLMSAMREGER